VQDPVRPVPVAGEVIDDKSSQHAVGSEG
jgi:hypothetical protein